MPLFWQKLFSKKIISLGLLSWAFIFSSYAQTNLNSKIQTTPGVIESLLQIIEIEKNQYTNLIKESEKKSLLITSADQIKDLKLDPFFVKSLLLNSDNKYLQFLKDGRDECQLISLFQNNLLKTSRGLINTVIINYLDKDGSRKRGLLTKNNFLEIYFKKKCINNKELGDLFNIKNIKRTVKGISLLTPKNQKECSQILNDWLDNPNTPFLCGINETMVRGEKAARVLPLTDKVQRRSRAELQRRIRESKKVSSQIPYFQRTYLKNLCGNIDNKKLFCDKYLAKDIWSKIVTGEKPDYLLKYKCKNVLRKEKLTKTEIKKCALKFKSEPNYCITNGNNKHLSLFPLENCHNISKALNHSRLITKYHDCPGGIDNEGIINIHRIMSHFNPTELPSTEITCASEPNLTFAKLNIQSNNSRGWPLKICFKNLATENKECYPYVPGASTSDKLSEDKVISKILKKVERTPFEVKCKLTNSRVYNPNRLGYKAGCFIVYDPGNCTTMHCPKEVYYETKLIDYLIYEGKILYDYFPTSFSNEKYATSNLMKETLKRDSKLIRNLTALKFFFENSKTGIVHGLGCAEDIQPQVFHRRLLNQCTPLPFIIDGISKEEGRTKLVFRSSISDIHTPKLMEWNILFNAVANYKELHPLSTWTLYGIK
ncbi:hypothetical protein A9Q84_05860 [Halobacteriovorax marinus]|uniref:Uncharacterized protein n=1 Tax=Halobacteriovorax marinus TaxID=97084 RepID=A0A1Y5FBF8_9BACT|nr:hypothetical protein A9Q84_05860 [Halobacteriovorax marinus]